MPVNWTKIRLSSCYSRTIYTGETGQTRKLLYLDTCLHISSTVTAFPTKGIRDMIAI